MDNYTFNWVPKGDVRNTNTHNSTALFNNATLRSYWISTANSNYNYLLLNVSATVRRLSALAFCNVFYLLHDSTEFVLLDQYNNANNGEVLHRQYTIPSTSRLKIQFHLTQKSSARCAIHDVCVLGQRRSNVTDFVTTSLPETTLTTSLSTLLPSAAPFSTIPPTTLTPSSTLSIIRPNISAVFSNNYLKLYILVTFNADNVLIDRINNNPACEEIFVDTQLLGADARCTWHQNEIEVQLTSGSIIDINDRLVMRSDAFYYIYSEQLHTLEHDMSIIVLVAQNPVEPLLVIDNLPPTLGICDDLILNAAFTQYLGARNAFFEWVFVSSAPSTSNSYLMSMGSLHGDIVSIPAAHIDLLSQLSLRLRVTTWFNVTVISEIFNIYKSEQLVPRISLSGPSSFSLTNNNYKHDYVHIVSTISYNVDCINASSASFPYSLSWSVSSTTLPTTSLEEIETVLSNIHSDNIAIDTSMIHPGNDYIFTVQFIASGVNATSASLSLFYEYSAIMCSINSADTIYLNTITEEQFENDYILFLNGYTMTYDPNALDIASKSHLTFDWQCVIPQYNLSCDYLFDSSPLSTEFVKYISFSSSLYNMYKFTMTVFDSQHTNRNPCVSSLDLVLDFIPSQNIAIQYLTVFISVNSNAMNSNDRLRVTVLMIGDDLKLNEYYHYEWTEVSGLISKTALEELNINDGLNGNLILESNVLQKGYTYIFQVNVTKWLLNSDSTSTLIGNGVSPTIDIEVLNGPQLSELTIYPQCNQTYESLSELLAAKHYISAVGDGEYLPLLYEFVYYFESDISPYEYSIHHSLLFRPYLLDVMLPFGSFTLKAIVYDSKASSSWNEMPCNIAIQNMDSDACISLTNDMLDPLDSQSTTKVLNDIFQTMPIYLQYIRQYYSQNVNCLQIVLSEIISVFTDQRILQNVNFCETDWSLSLGQIYATYFEMLIQFDVVYDLFVDDDYLNGIKSIISLILDPCGAISDTITDVNLLFLSPQSIIDGNVVIYYGSQDNAVDITNTINQNILSDSESSHVLYELCSSLISIMNDCEDKFAISTDDIMELLSKSLYIHALHSIATSIPGETVQSESDGFEIYSSRIGVDGDVDVSLHDIQITIDNDVFADGRDSFCDLTQSASNCVYDSVDIVIIAQNNTKNDAIIEKENECNNNVVISDYNGTISNESLSIVLIGGNLSTSASNATITFTKDKYYDQLQCVWLDETTTTWKNTGCSTIVDEEFNTIQCDCNHLTTFSIAYNINTEGGCDNILALIISNPTKWNALHIVFAILFIFPLFHSSLEVLPFIIHKKFNPVKDQVFISMSSVFIISLINVSLCISFTSIALQSANIPFLTFLLLSPQWFYFIIFGIVLYSWVIVAQSLDHQSQAVHSVYSSNVLSKSLQITTIVLIACGVLEFIIVSSIKQTPQILWIYTASQIFWICLLLISSIIFSVFGYKAQQIVRITALLLRSVDSNSKTNEVTLASPRTNELVDQNVRLSYKLLLTTIVVTAFFFIQCILCIYFLAINHYQHMFAFRIIDLLSHYICLLVICWLYKQTFNRLRAEYEIKAVILCDRERINLFLEKIKPKRDVVQTRQAARSVSVASTVLTGKTSNSVAKTATNTVPTAPPPISNPPSLQMSERSHDINVDVNIDIMPPLTTIREAFGQKSDDKSLSLIENDELESSSMQIAPPRIAPSESSVSKPKKTEPQPKTAPPVSKKAKSPKKKAAKKGTRVSVFQRKDLLQLSTVKLAKMCREQKLSSKGNKADMVNRLLAAAKRQKNKKSAAVPPMLKPVASRSYE